MGRVLTNEVLHR